MGYTRVNWEDAPSEKTPLTAENLNIMDAGIKTLDEEKLGLEGDASGTTVEFEESSELTAVTSKSTLKTLFGIVAKAVSSLISHVSNTTLHITAAERTAWNGKQSALGYTPVQQGGGTGQLANKVYVGWNGSRVKVQVDDTDMGDIVFQSHLDSHTQPASRVTAGTFAGQVQANATAMATLDSAQVRDIYIASSEITEGGSSSLANGTIVFTKG